MGYMSERFLYDRKIFAIVLCYGSVVVVVVHLETHGFRAVTFVPFDRFLWNFNTMILYNIKPGIENQGPRHTRLETMVPKGLEMVHATK